MQMMKVVAIAILALLATSAHGATVQSPVTKVVQLLQNLSEKLEKEMKVDTDMYANYVCWYKKTVESKEVNNQAAKARIESLEAHIEDISAGRIEFTTERDDLEAEMNGITGDIKTASLMREQEASDFEAGTAEIRKAITILGDAIAFVEQGFNNLAQQQNTALFNMKSDLRKVVQMGEGFLSAEQAAQLSAFASQPFDYENLNKYKKAGTESKQMQDNSKKIAETLRAMQKTFQDNLDDAQSKENVAVQNYETLKASKEQQYQKSQTAYTSYAEEQGARALEKEQAIEEKGDLESQITNDEQFIADVKAANEVKEKEWAERRQLRSNELLAISKAISILSSDNARSAFRDSLGSVVTFLQESKPCLQKQAALSKALPVARSVLLQVENSMGKRNGTISDGVISQNSSNGVSLVMEHITQLKANLAAEEAADVAKAQECEQTLQDTAHQARTQSLAVDQFSAEIEQAQGRVNAISEQIKAEDASLVELKDQLNSITRRRDEESRDFNKRKATDEKAMQLLDDAATVLSQWMSGGGNAAQSELFEKNAKVSKGKPAAVTNAKASLLSQKQNLKQDPTEGVPQTQEGAYTGAEADKGGILNILSLLKEDLRKELELASNEENTAESAFNTQKNAVEASIGSAESAIEGYTEQRSGELQLKVDKTAERDTKSTELKSTVAQYHGVWPGCEFIQTNMEVRRKKRAAEMSGLDNAMTILTDASETMVGVSLAQQC